MSETQPRLAIRTNSTPLAVEYDVMFDCDIESPQEFQEHWYVMREAKEGDKINVHLSSNGGDATTISTFQDIVKKSDAHFHGILEGSGYSAGGAIFLLCDTHEVADLADMMVHTVQTGYSSHGQGVTEFGKQVSRTSKKLIELVYRDFLTEVEIEDVLKGAELWLDADQIRERLTNREVIRQKQAIDSAKENYTPEIYAEEVLMDLTEDCNAFEWNLADVVNLMFEKVSGVSCIAEEPSPQMELNLGEDIQSLEEPQTLLEFIKEEMDIENLKLVASEHGIYYTRNISLETLRKKLLDSEIAE